MRTYITVVKCRVEDLQEGDVVLLNLLGAEYASWRVWSEADRELMELAYCGLDLVQVQVEAPLVPVPRVVADPAYRDALHGGV